MSHTPRVKVERLVKRYGDVEAVSGIDFEIQPGEIVGLLGPNGAGKTTTIHMLLDLVSPTSGALSICGLRYPKDREAILKRVNTVASNSRLPGKLTVEENLLIYADLYEVVRPRQRVEVLLDRCDLLAVRHRRTGTLSTGEGMRAMLCKALLNEPQLLLLDEPTVGLDPDVADRTRRMLRDEVASGAVSVLLTSHNMREVESICDRVLFLHQGHIIAQGTPEMMAARLQRCRIRYIGKNVPAALKTWLAGREATVECVRDQVVLDVSEQDVPHVIETLVTEGLHVEGLEVERPTLEEFFIRVTRGDQPAEVDV